MKWLAKLANLFKFVCSVSVASVMRASKCTYHNNTEKSAAGKRSFSSQATVAAGFKCMMN